MKGLKYYSVILLSALGIGIIGIGALLLMNGGLTELAAISNGTGSIGNSLKGIIGITLVFVGIVSYKPLDVLRKQLRDEYEYDENGISKKKGRFSDLSAKERDQIEQQKMIDAERILDSPTVKKITHSGEANPVQAMETLIGLPKIKNQMREMAARMQYELQEYEKSGKKLRKGQTIPHSSMHMCFYGPPGTGKTTCARIMTGFLYQYRYLCSRDLSAIPALEYFSALYCRHGAVYRSYAAHHRRLQQKNTGRCPFDIAQRSDDDASCLSGNQRPGK